MKQIDWLDVEQVGSYRPDCGWCDDERRCLICKEEMSLEVLKAIAALEDSPCVASALMDWEIADVRRALAKIILVAREVAEK